MASVPPKHLLADYQETRRSFLTAKMAKVICSLMCDSPLEKNKFS